MASLLFISSSGLLLSQHFCQGELKSVAVFAEATPCHAVTKRACPHHPPAEQAAQQHKSGCCDTAYPFLQLDADQLAAEICVLPLDLQVALAVLVPSLQLLSEEEARRNLHYLNYKPPLLVCDLPVSLQTFRC